MADKNKIDTRYHYEFINNVIASFFKTSLDYFSKYLNPRFRYSMISTYDKAVEYLKNKNKLDGRELDKPNLPAIILNPSGDFGISDTGKQLYRFPNIAPGLIKRIYDPIYQDDNVLVTVGFTRIKGEFELLVLTNSFYEYCDIKLLMIQIFGGTERVIYPKYFDSFIILPNDLVTYNYENEYTGQSYKLDWDIAGAKQELIKSTDKTEWIFPVRIKPWYKLNGISDASSRYGGIDKLADWRLSLSVEYEVEIPSYLVLETNYLVHKMQTNVGYGSVFSKYPEFYPDEYKTIINSGDSTSEEKIEKIKFKTRYFHIITDSEYDNEIDFEVTLPEKVLNIKLLYINSKNGLLKYGDHYILETDGITLKFKYDNLNLISGDILEIYIYVRE